MIGSWSSDLLCRFSILGESRRPCERGLRHLPLPFPCDSSLCQYLKVVLRLYKGEVDLEAVRTQCQSILEAVVSSMERVVRVRGVHVS